MEDSHCILYCKTKYTRLHYEDATVMYFLMKNTCFSCKNFLKYGFATDIHNLYINNEFAYVSLFAGSENRYAGLLLMQLLIKKYIENYNTPFISLS